MAIEAGGRRTRALSDGVTGGGRYGAGRMEGNFTSWKFLVPVRLDPNRICWRNSQPRGIRHCERALRERGGIFVDLGLSVRSALR